jgi:hypothetical protein
MKDVWIVPIIGGKDVIDLINFWRFEVGWRWENMNYLLGKLNTPKIKPNL